MNAAAGHISRLAIGERTPKNRWIRPIQQLAVRSRSIPGTTSEGSAATARAAVSLVVDTRLPGGRRSTPSERDLHLRRQHPRRGNGRLDRRRARRAALHYRHEPPGRIADGRGKRDHPDPAHLRPGRNPHGRRRLHPAAARALRGPDPPPRLVLRRRRRPGGAGHHDAAALSATSSSPAPSTPPACRTTPAGAAIFHAAARPLPTRRGPAPEAGSSGGLAEQAYRRNR